MEQITYELKYCERCGALGTRRAHSAESYCESCAQILTQVVVPGAVGRRFRKPVLAPASLSSQSVSGRVQ
jgi:hypothetical protein